VAIADPATPPDRLTAWLRRVVGAA